MSLTISSTPALTVQRQPLPFALLQPRSIPARSIGIIIDPTCWDDAVDTVRRTGGVVALDIETNGLDPLAPDATIVGLGLAGAEYNYYFSANSDAGTDGLLDLIKDVLSIPDIRWIAHNAYFDGQWIRARTGMTVPFHACTYMLYRQLATEGWQGQSWGLKNAMTDCLLWDAPNDEELKQWLVDNGWVNGAGNPKKGEMWRAPTEILGKYCLLDCEATYLFYVHILEPVLRQFPKLAEFHHEKCMSHLQMLIWQKLVGIMVDRDQLHKAEAEIGIELADLKRFIYDESDLSDPIREYNAAAWNAFLATEPPRYLKKKESEEPQYLTKKGTVSKVWLNWHKKQTTPPVESKVWAAWQVKRQKREEAGTGGFNLRSGDDLRWLFYDRLGITPLEYTEGMLPSVDTDSLRTYGPGGAALEKYLLGQKELSFVTDYLERTERMPVICPGFRVPGTLTGRLSGVDPNIQQVVKTERFLSALVARPGYVWIDADFTALEPVVCTELSGDPQLMQVFGPSAPAGADIYLHTGLGIPQFREQILKAGYDPERLTAEKAAAAKKECKQIRSICKVLYLSSSYGAGPKKICKTLAMQGVSLGLSEVEEMHAQYWEFYQGIKIWERKLKDEWRRNKGWVLNGIGRPLGVHKDFLKDIVNRVVQSTGHDLLIEYSYELEPLLSSLDWRPTIWDYHDEIVMEVREDQAHLAIAAFRQAQVLLNATLGGSIPLRINPVLVRNLAEAKCE